jgi:hypothetical protein
VIKHFDHITIVVRNVEAAKHSCTSHNRMFVFLSGPEGITVELAEWD